MTNDQFRALEILSGSGHAAHHKPDDLLAAAVAGFTSLTRPGRYESQQFEDLALPLLETATPHARRQVSAVLAQHDVAPRKLILTLANDCIEVAAPLLLRSPVLTSSDLTDIIATHGLSHARIIARRQPLDAMLLPLLHSFDDTIIDQSINGEHTAVLPEPVDNSPKVQVSPAPQDTVKVESKTSAPLPEAHNLGDLPLKTYIQPVRAEYLIDMALLLDNSMFRVALADALDVSYGRAEQIIGSWPNSQLPLALKAIGLTAQDTYLILTAVLGTIHGEREQLREFVHIYRSISTEQALAAVKRWKAADMSDRLRDKLRDLADQPENFTNAANYDNSGMQKKAQ